MDCLRAEQIESEAGADDIGDGIDRAHFVEVHLFDRYAVDPGFGLAQPLKTASAFSLVRSGRLAPSIIARDVRKMAMLVSFDTFDVELCRGDTVPLGLLEAERGACLEGAERFQQDVLSAPASTRAPTVMSPLIPEKASR